MKLKHNVVFILFFLLTFNNTIFAQFSVGIQGGLNSAILYLSNKAPEGTLYYREGFVVGTIINYEYDDMLNMRSEPRYIQKGERATLNLPGYKTDSKIYFNYIELPIYIVAEFTNTQLKPFLLGGINFGYLISAKSESIINNEEYTFDIKSDYENIDIAIDLGMGIKYELDKTTSFLLSARYSYGIFDITGRDGTVSTRGIQILFGILYKL